MAGAVGAVKFNGGGNEGNYNNDGNDEREVILNEGKITEEKAPVKENKNPGDATDDVVESKEAVGHAAKASDERREGADNGNKAGEDDSFGAIFFIKAVRAFQIFTAKEAGIFILKKAQAEEAAEPVVGGVA